MTDKFPFIALLEAKNMVKTKQRLPKYKQRFLEDLQYGLEHSVNYFADENKQTRESWIVHEFLSNLELPFLETEIITSPSDPPDVIFRDALFEIKEILDHGRRRHQEFKEQLIRSFTVEDPADLLSPCVLIYDLTPQDIIQLIEEKLKQLEKKYAPAVRFKLDLLFYINWIHHTLKIERMPDLNGLEKFGWRSITALFGWASIIYYASDAAPGFLQEKRSQLIVKTF